MFKLKIAQIISYVLSLNGNQMNLLKIMQELYLADRVSIEERNTSISGDVYFSLSHGPVLSVAMNLLRDGSFKEFFDQIHDPYYPDIVLKQSAGDDLLSQKDKAYIEAVSKQFKNYSPRELEQYTHQLPEWIDPAGSSIKIRFQDIMHALNKTNDEIATAKLEYEQICNLSKSLF